MRKLLIILGIILLLDIFYFAFLNQGQTLSLNYRPLIDQFNFNSGLLYALLGAEGAVAGFLITYYFLLNAKDRLKKLNRVTEKAGIEVEECSDKVKSLQSKIATLEMALKEALKKK